MGLAAPVFAQTAAPTPPMDYAARVESVATMKEYIAQREQRFEAVKADLKTLDARVEERIDYIVKTLASLKDSKESKTRVANIKADVITALRRSIGIYRQKRMEIFERMRKEKTVPEVELAANVDLFDKRVSKRVDQVLELAKSLSGHEDVEKYETSSSYSNGWYEETTRISEDYKQNRRESTNTDVQRRDLLQALNKTLDEQDSRRRSITQSLTNSTLTDAQRSLRQGELGRVDAAIDNLKLKRRELAIPSGAATKEIGRTEVSDVEKMLDDSRGDLARDFNDIFTKFSELDRERTKIYELKDNLKAREEWLKNNPPPAK